MRRMVSRSADETVAFGRSFADSLRPGDVVALCGTLGSGKTSFASGICLGLGVKVHATSPTFTLINEYPSPFGMVAHVDLYRIAGEKEVAELGIEEYFNERCICLIEWPEQVRDMLPRECLHVRFAHGVREEERTIEVEERREPAA